MDNSLQRTERLYLKLGLIGLAAIILLIAGIWGGARVFHQWQGRRFVEQAAAAAERGNDSMAASLAARAYSLDAGDVEALRLLAVMAERHRETSAVEWRRRICELRPQSAVELLALAKTALRFRMATVAEGALTRLDAKAKASAEYFATAAQLATLRNDPGMADEHYAAALKLEPQNVDLQLGRALVDLRLPERRAAAEEVLRSFFNHSTHGRVARGVLLADAIARSEWAVALPIAQELATNAGAEFNDRLVCLDLLQRAGSAEAAAYLTDLETRAAPMTDDAVALLLWMQENALAAEGVKWAATLPSATKTKPTLKAALALCFLNLEDWSALESLVESDNWGEWDYLRLALRARDVHHHGLRDLFGSAWTEAVAAAAKQPGGLDQLLRLTTTWGWTSELREIYWVWTETQRGREALYWLYRSYAQEGNTPGLLRVTKKLSEMDPGDERTKNNLILFAILSRQATEIQMRTAQELYEKHPGDATYASTYAFAVFVQGRVPDAIKVMRALPSEAVQDPSVAAYFGIFLSASAEKDEAAKFLALAQSAKLLPEERALVREAMERLHGAPAGS